MEALKKWNAKRSSWCVPRKGTKDYDEVIAIKNRMVAPMRTAATKKRVYRTPHKKGEPYYEEEYVQPKATHDFYD